MCQDRSKFASATHRGGARPNGTSTTRCRKLGTSRVPRSIISHRRSQSGEASSRTTATIVDRSAGSFSMLQVR